MQSVWLSIIVVTLPQTLYSIAVDEFYPFGYENGDAKMELRADVVSSPIEFPSTFNFFTAGHNRCYVSTNGYIVLSRSASQFIPKKFPTNLAFISPFWADSDVTKGGAIWYRLTTEETIKNRATYDVKTFFPKMTNFQASWVIVATWYDLPFYGCSSLGGCLKRNTFQAVMISNDSHSFAIFNYGKITWTTGTSSGGNTQTGLGGTGAQVGLNAGDSVRFFQVDVGFTPEVVDIDEMSNVGIPGVFVFRIDDSEVLQACQEGYISKITITPNSGPMLGGQYITLGGPCVDSTATVVASFSGSQKYKCQRQSQFSIGCVTPVFNTTGEIIINIEIEQQDTTRELNYLYTVVNPADSKIRVYRQDPEDWYEGQHNISWDADAVELENTDTVDIFLFSLIKEVDGRLSWTSKLLQEGVQRSAGWAQISLETQEFVHAIRVTSATVQADQPRRGIWSDIFPLALPPAEAVSFCGKWYRQDLKLPPLQKYRIQPCPCTLEQAFLDSVRFHPDPNCNLFNQVFPLSMTGNCLNRKAANHCVRLNILGPGGMDNICCYDKESKLIQSKEVEGGTLQRYHYLGGKSIQPFFDNFYYDVIPFVYCCRYSKHKSKGMGTSNCHQYLRRRPQSSCLHYVPPRPALTVGDPHFTSLDGYKYSFNGVGEFVYLRTDDNSFQSQIRLEQFRKANGDLSEASVCTSFVSQHLNQSAVVEIRLDSANIAEVLVNGDVINFDESLSYQFQGVSVIQLPPVTFDAEANEKVYQVSFTSGISFQTTASSNVLNIIPVVGNTLLSGHLRGLLGDFDGDLSNDLRTPSDGILLPTSSSEDIYRNFGLLWMISEEESLFTYKDATTYSDFQNPSFVPTFETPSDLPEDVVEVCGDDKECTFDYAVSGSPELATETRKGTQRFKSLLDAFALRKSREKNQKAGL